ncbi:MAG TPA: hypothetical protein VFN79_04200, partial [Steroidobacteraceae bacterium]|nr:hypothetical protein [Steroidobacteraceae bacterium]
LFPASPHRGDEVRRLQHIQVLRHALARHVQVLAELIERAAVVRVQQVTASPSARRAADSATASVRLEVKSGEGSGFPGRKQRRPGTSDCQHLHEAVDTRS